MAVIQMPSRGGKDETGMITTWYKKTGDWVAQGDELFSFDTDEGTFTVKSQKAGRLVAIFVPEGELVHCPADVGMLSAPTPESVLNLGRQSYLDETPAPEAPAAEAPESAPTAPQEEPSAEPSAEPVEDTPSEDLPETPVEAENTPAENPNFSEEELLQYVEDDTDDLEALDTPAQQEEIEADLTEANLTEADLTETTPPESLDEPAVGSPITPSADDPVRPACLTADADLTVCMDVAQRTGVRIASMVRYAAMHTALAEHLTPAEPATLRQLDALPALPDVLDLSATAVTAASVPSDGALRLIVPAPQQTLRPNGDALELYPVLHLSLAFDERTLPVADAAQALSDTCAHLENLLSLLI